MMKSLPIDFFSLKGGFKKQLVSLMILFVLLTSVNVFSQNFENVTITGINSGAGTNNVLFNANSPTIPNLARVRVQKLSGGPTVQITFTNDNFSYRHVNPGITPGIPNNVTRMRVSFLQADGITPVPVNDFRFIINDIDGPNNESLGTNCGANVRFTATAVTTNLIIDNVPPDLNATGTQTESDGLPSRVMYEFNDITFIEFDIYANNNFIKEFD